VKRAGGKKRGPLQQRGGGNLDAVGVQEVAPDSLEENQKRKDWINTKANIDQQQRMLKRVGGV